MSSSSIRAFFAILRLHPQYHNFYIDKSSNLDPNSLTYSTYFSNADSLLKFHSCDLCWTNIFKPADENFLLKLQKVIIFLKAFLSIFTVEFQLKETHFFLVCGSSPLVFMNLSRIFCVYKRQEESMNIKRREIVRQQALKKKKNAWNRRKFNFIRCFARFYTWMCGSTEEDTFGACVSNQDTFFASCFMLFPNIAEKKISLPI